MNVDELTDAVRKMKSQDDWPGLVARVRELGDDESFRLLFPLATSSQYHCALAYTAALLLYAIKPACPLPCKEAVRSLLGNWDVSIQEVPWYLCAFFGRRRVSVAIQELSRDPLSSEQTTRLSTIDYWLGVPQTEQSPWK